MASAADRTGVLLAARASHPSTAAASRAPPIIKANGCVGSVTGRTPMGPGIGGRVFRACAGLLPTGSGQGASVRLVSHRWLSKGASGA